MSTNERQLTTLTPPLSDKSRHPKSNPKMPAKARTTQPSSPALFPPSSNPSSFGPTHQDITMTDNTSFATNDTYSIMTEATSLSSSSAAVAQPRLPPFTPQPPPTHPPNAITPTSHPTLQDDTSRDSTPP